MSSAKEGTGNQNNPILKYKEGLYKTWKTGRGRTPTRRNRQRRMNMWSSCDGKQLFILKYQDRQRETLIETGTQRMKRDIVETSHWYL